MATMQDYSNLETDLEIKNVDYRGATTPKKN